MHILLVRFSSMGDVVLQTATINWLRALFGRELRLSFLTSREFLPLIEGHPGLDDVVAYDRRGESWKELLNKLDQLDQRHQIDLILDLHATMRSFRLKLSFWTIPALTIDKRRWERFLLTKLKGKPFKRLIHPKIFGLEPQVERLILDMESIFGDLRGVWRTRDVRQGPHGEMTSLKSLPAREITEPYVVLAPSASFAPKRWPVERFVELARRLLQETELKLVVLAGPQDDFCQAFDQINSDRLLNLQGKTSLAESMGLIQRSVLTIGNDSGMNHIAEAHGVPCLTLFGPTDPRFGFAPHGQQSGAISKELWCKPCSTTGKSPCFRERHFCMELITVEEVLEHSLKILRAR
jgi:ADP-heptose:LPS heptosyltransferase